LLIHKFADVEIRSTSRLPTIQLRTQKR